MGNQAALGRLVERFQNALQEVVGFFQFIIKEGVALGKLEGIEIELFHHREAQAVERGEHPAASALFLIGNLALFEADRKLMHVLARDLVILRAGVDAVSGDRVHGDSVDRVLVESLFKLAEIFHRNIGVHNHHSFKNSAGALPEIILPPFCKNGHSFFFFYKKFVRLCNKNKMECTKVTKPFLLPFKMSAKRAKLSVLVGGF